MKKLTVFLLILLLLTGCARGEDTRVEEIRVRIQSLPNVEELAALPFETQQEVYYRTQEAYDDFRTLTDKEQASIPEAEKIFGELFSYFNSLVMPLMETAPETQAPTEPTVEETLPDVLSLTQEEKLLLLKLGMAERGDTGCVQCTALVMNTVLNRLADKRFPSSIKSIIYAQDQFTPVAEGTYETAQPNELCHEALTMVIKGWDESQGALYYEWCQGESWHSKNLNLLFQHCDTRFYK